MRQFVIAAALSVVAFFVVAPQSMSQEDPRISRLISGIEKLNLQVGMLKGKVANIERRLSELETKHGYAPAPMSGAMSRGSSLRLIKSLVADDGSMLGGIFSDGTVACASGRLNGVPCAAILDLRKDKIYMDLDDMHVSADLVIAEGKKTSVRNIRIDD